MTEVLYPENAKSDIGHFMVAAGAVIEHPTENKILILKRADKHHFGEWEIPYGRLSQHEEITIGLKRELKEEIGLEALTIIRALAFWHIYRGDTHAETEVFGMTFLCKANSTDLDIDDAEHSAYQWVSPEEALSLIKVPGIRKDVEVYLENPTYLPIYSSSGEKLL